MLINNKSKPRKDLEELDKYECTVSKKDRIRKKVNKEMNILQKITKW